MTVTPGGQQCVAGVPAVTGSVLHLRLLFKVSLPIHAPHLKKPCRDVTSRRTVCRREQLLCHPAAALQSSAGNGTDRRPHTALLPLPPLPATSPSPLTVVSAAHTSLTLQSRTFSSVGFPATSQIPSQTQSLQTSAPQNLLEIVPGFYVPSSNWREVECFLGKKTVAQDGSIIL